MISLPVSAEEFNFEVSDVIKAECCMFFHKLQFCSAWTYKCAMMGAIAQRPFNMSVWKDVTLRMNQYWKRRGVQIDQQMWKRAQDKMVSNCVFVLSGGLTQKGARGQANVTQSSTGLYL
jgi:hypothetical protein